MMGKSMTRPIRLKKVDPIHTTYFIFFSRVRVLGSQRRPLRDLSGHTTHCATSF
jgi:hypothetical protein